MILHGHFQNGVVVLDGGTPLPDGTAVTIAERDPLGPRLHVHPGPRIRIQSPLVPSEHPGTISHSPEQIDAFLHDDEMPSYINVWVALAFASKAEHARAKTWFQGQVADSCLFCRHTQLGFLRLATNVSMLGSDAKTMHEAWQALDQLYQDFRVAFLDEPPGIDSELRPITQRNTKSPKLWGDAYLAAFAKLDGLELVTFDTGFRQFAGLACTIL